MPQRLRSSCRAHARRARIRERCAYCVATSAGGGARPHSCALPWMPSTGCWRMARARSHSLRSAGSPGLTIALRSNASLWRAPSDLAVSCRRRHGQGDPIDLRCTDEVVLGETADGVRREEHAAVVVPEFNIGMMILKVRNVRERIDEAHRAIEIPKCEFAAQRVRISGEMALAGNVAHQLQRLRARQRRDTALAGFAALLGERAHRAASLRAKLRAT